MFIASDYSGQHKGATHEAYSFLVTTESAISEWLPIRDKFRQTWLPDGRRISFKQLSERVRKRALGPFLEAANHLRGNVVTFLVHQRVGSFLQGGSDTIVEPFPDCFSSDTPAGTVEKMFRVASFVATLVSGFRREHQPSVWFSDHDETLATFHRREQLGRLASYLTFGCTRWRNPAESVFGTTQSSEVPPWIEDIVAIPDLIAGAYCVLSSVLPTFFGREHWTHVISSEAVSDSRALMIGNWMATQHGELRPILARLELDSAGMVRASAQIVIGHRG